MKQVIRKGTRWLLVFVMLLGVLSNVDLTVNAADSEAITLGSFDATGTTDNYSGSFTKATGSGTKKYNGLTIGFSKKSNKEGITIPTTVDGYTYASELSTVGYTYVIKFSDKTAKQVAEEYIRKVTFSNCKSGNDPQVYFILHAETPAVKTIYHASNDHYYQYVAFPSGTYKNWIDCYNEAKNMTFAGRMGYLATVTSSEESSFIYSASDSVGWLGGTTIIHKANKTSDGLHYEGFDTDKLQTKLEDASKANGATYDYWYWACGPEIGKVFYNKLTYNGSASSTNVDSNCNYSKWRDGEPNRNFEEQTGNYGYEACLTSLHQNDWNDITYNRSDGNSDWCPKGYFVEYGDQTNGDSHNSSSSDMTVTSTELCVYATLEKKSYTVTVRESGHGTLTSSVPDANEGDTVTLTTTPADGYMLDDIAFLSSDTASSISMTALSGTQDTDEEGYAKLFDGNTSTKWCTKSIPGSVIFKASEKCIISGYTLTTAADAAANQGRNWKKWALYGANFASDSAATDVNATGWTLIASVENDNTLTAENNKTYSYSTGSNSTAYQYYVLEVSENQNSDSSATDNMIQMSEMAFTGYTISSIALTDKKDGTYTFTMPAKNVIILAGFIPKYKVTYDSNGGTGTAVTDNNLYLRNTTVTVKDKGTLTKEGYVFAGWNGKNSNGKNTTYKADSTFTITGDVSLSAYWKESIAGEIYANDYSVEYDGNEHGIYVTYPEDATVTYSDKENGTYTGTERKYKDVGTYTIYYKVEDKDHLESIKGSASVTITKKPITISVADQEKIYGESDPVISMDQYTVTDALASSDALTSISITRAQGKTVGEYAYTLSNAQIQNDTTAVTSNYDISYETEAKLTVTKRPVTISSITAGKEYDGTTAAVFDVGYSGKVSGDDLKISVTGAYDNKNVGTGKNVSISDIALTGTDSGNYELKGEQQTACKGIITAKAVTVSKIEALDKLFDRTTAAELDFSNVNIEGLLGNDDLHVDAKGEFADVAVGDIKKVNISGLKLTGNDAGNYVLAASGQQTECEAAIHKIPVTVSGITAVSKIYDGNNKAELKCDKAVFEGILDGDSLTVSATGTFVDKNAANDKRVSISNLALSGTDVENYTLSTKGQQVAATASITKKTVKVGGIKAVDKYYDGTTTVKLDDKELKIDGKLDGDDLTCEVEGGFADAKVGNDKPVNIEKSNIKLAGKDAGNYEPAEISFEETESAVTANITPRPVTVSGITAKNKVYDGTKTATLDLTSDNVILQGKVYGEKLSVSAKGEFADENAGKGKTVNISMIELTGDDKSNYILADARQTECEADIMPMPVIISGITAKNKGYDGTTDATFEYDNVIMKDTNEKAVEEDGLLVEAKGYFEDAAEGTDKTVIISEIKLTGDAAGNYELAASGQQTECKANITGLTIKVSGIKAKTKTYDGKTGAVLDMDEAVLEGKAEGDRVLVSAVGEFEDEKAGTGKKVTILSMHLTGKDAANYSLAVEGQQTECEGTILPKEVTVSGITAKNKGYDGTTDAALLCDGAAIDGKLKADKVTVTAKGTFRDKLPGTEKEVAISDYVLDGADAGNYILAEDGQQLTTTADITIVNDVVDEEIENPDGSVTYKETEYKDGKVSKVTAIVTGADSGETDEETNAAEKTVTVYDAEGIIKSTTVTTTDSEGNITKVVTTDSEKNETVIVHET